MAYLGTKPANQVIDSTLIADGTVTTSDLADNAITTAKIAAGAVIPADLSTGAPVWDTNGNVGIGTSSPSQKLHIGGNTLLPVSNSYYCYTSDYGMGTPDSNGLQIFAGSGDSIRFGHRASGTFTERMRIDSSGSVGIGTSSPIVTYNARFAVVAGATQTGISIDAASGTNTSINWSNTGTLKWATQVLTTNEFRFYDFTSNTERMRIDNSGNLLVGITGTINSQSSSTINNTNASYPSLYVRNTTASNVAALRVERGDSDGDAITFWRSNTQRGYITVASTGTTYNTLSDYRLKENVEPMTGALAKVSALNPVTYNWKGIGKKGQGFIAHELKEIVPECVTGEKDELDDDGNPRYQGIDTSFLVATLTAAIQEQQAIIQSQADTISAMEARLTALENK